MDTRVICSIHSSHHTHLNSLELALLLADVCFGRRLLELLLGLLEPALDVGVAVAELGPLQQARLEQHLGVGHLGDELVPIRLQLLELAPHHLAAGRGRVHHRLLPPRVGRVDQHLALLLHYVELLGEEWRNIDLLDQHLALLLHYVELLEGRMNKYHELPAAKTQPQCIADDQSQEGWGWWLRVRVIGHLPVISPAVSVWCSQDSMYCWWLVSGVGVGVRVGVGVMVEGVIKPTCNFSSCVCMV